MNRYKKKKLMLRLLFVVMLFAVSAVVMLLWNALLPELLGTPKVSYWQAMGIFVLAKILFGGFRPGGCGAYGAHNQMNTENKEKFREIMRERLEKFCKK